MLNILIKIKIYKVYKDITCDINNIKYRGGAVEK